jgi:hypothetical protein
VAAKLIISCEVLCSVNQAAFVAEVKTEKCECSKQAFVRCSKFCVWLYYFEYYAETFMPVITV